MSRVRGFTLLEVMVAVAILALVAAMVHATLQRHLHNARLLEDRALAAWVADTTLAELQLQGAGAMGSNEDIVEQGGRRWRVLREVQAMPEPQLRRVHIRVSAATGGEVGISLTGFVGAQQ